MTEEKRSKEVEEELAWQKYRASKGWVPETVATHLYEFIKDVKLFGKLLEYAKKRK